MECLYGPHSPKKPQLASSDADVSSSKVEPKPSAEDPAGMEVYDVVADPFGPLVFEDEPKSDSILDDILSEEGKGFLTDIEMVGFLPQEL